MPFLLLILHLLITPVFCDEPVKTVEKQMVPLEPDPGKSGKALFGAIVATVPGFGIGHAIQGRYSERGWLFTFGEIVGLGGGIAMLGIRCGTKNKNECNAAKAIGALFTFGTYLGLHVWEAVDAWKWYSAYDSTASSWNSPREGDIALALRFQF